jgi:hypothetical protein
MAFALGIVPIHQNGASQDFFDTVSYGPLTQRYLQFNALSGVGGGGQQDASTANNSLLALVLSIPDTVRSHRLTTIVFSALQYTCFATTSFFSGTINNILGSRLTLFIGSFGYALVCSPCYLVWPQALYTELVFVSISPRF